MMTAAFQDRRFRAVAIALCVLKIWFVLAQPMVVVAGAGHDDRLFFARANDIAGWKWLGDYDQMTLAKGVGYPLFIVGSFLLNLPLPLAEQLLYLFACWALIRALRPQLGHDAWALLLFATLAWQPMSYVLPQFLPGNGSVVRQNIYTPLTLLIFAGLIGLHTRRAAAARVRAMWATLLGLSGGWFWLTREEGVWLGPSVGLLLAVAAVAVWRERLAWRRALWPYGAAALVMAVPIATVSAINKGYYNWFGTCEFRSSAYRAAYAALLRVDVGPRVQRIPLTNQARLAVYEVSPAFAELRPLLEGPLHEQWAGSPTDEYSGALWMWALRDAVAETIHPPDAGTALAYYQRIADEVNAACDEGKIPAIGRRSSFLPPWQPEHTRDLWVCLPLFAKYFLTFEGFTALPMDSISHGAPDLLVVFRDLGRWQISPTEDVPAPHAPRTRRLQRFRLHVLEDIGNIVRRLDTVAIGLGFVAWLGSLGYNAWRRTVPDYLWWVATSAIGGAAAIWLISILVHITSWVDLRPLRLHQGYPLLLLFAGTAAVDFVARLSVRRRASTTTPPIP
jgi:hypothetical protein